MEDQTVRASVAWEYITIYADKYWLVTSHIQEDGRSDPQERIGFVEYLNYLGKNGWELINVLPVEVGYRGFLKRVVVS